MISSSLAFYASVLAISESISPMLHFYVCITTWDRWVRHLLKAVCSLSEWIFRITLLKPTENVQLFYSATVRQCKKNSLTRRIEGLITSEWIACVLAFNSCFPTYSLMRPLTPCIVGVISSSILCSVFVNRWYTLKYLKAFRIFCIVRRFSSRLSILFFPSISLRNFLRATYTLRFLSTLLLRARVLFFRAITYPVHAEKTSLSTYFSLNCTVRDSILAVND